MPRQDKVFVCFQKAEDDTHKLYIYDDVTAYGTFNWNTWSYEESETALTRNRNRFVERSTRKSLDLCRFSRVRKRKNL